MIVRQYDAGLARLQIGEHWVVPPEWAIAQSVPNLPRRNAVAVMDSLLNKQVITKDGLTRSRDLARGRRGMGQARSWWDLVDGRSESPLETFARLDCIAGGVPPDDLQVRIANSRGAVVARGDLGWRLGAGRWLIAEIDGAEFHDSPQAVFRDRRRQNTLMSLGHAMLRFTYRDVAKPGVVSSGVAQMLGRLRTRSASARDSL